MKKTNTKITFKILSLISIATINSVAVASSSSSCAFLDSNESSKVLDEFSAQIAGDVTLIKSEILSAYSPLSENKGSLWIPKTLGFRMTAALPANSVDINDYLNTQIMIRDGGVLNGYFSLNTAVSWFDKCSSISDLAKKSSSTYKRRFVPDRIFMHLFPLPDTLLPYFTHGIGIKALRTNIESNDTSGSSTTDNIEAAGVIYLGIGVEGPMYKLSPDSTPSSKGTFNFETTLMATRTSQDFIDAAYGESIKSDWIYSATVNMELMISDSVAIIISYNAPLGDAKDFADEVTAFSVSYNLGR